MTEPSIRPIYSETTSADGAWQVVLNPRDLMSRERVHKKLVAACTPALPITAAIQTTLCAVDRIVLLRDPSHTHGTPSIEDCETLTDSLSASEGWDVSPVIGLEPALTVMLGLREGYDENAPVHNPRVVYEHLNSRRVVRYQVDPVHLVSARWVDGKIRTYDEPGVLLAIEPVTLPAVAELAGMLRQDRFVVTDFPADRTFVMRASRAEVKAKELEVDGEAGAWYVRILDEDVHHTTEDAPVNIDWTRDGTMIGVEILGSGESQAELRDVLDFLIARQDARNRWMEPRCWGISSDALAYYGAGKAAEPHTREYPVDAEDLAACERTYEMAPAAIKPRMLPVLDKYRVHLVARARAEREDKQ